MPSTRIAVATSDGLSVCSHLARSTGFLILEVDNGVIRSRTYRSRATDTCGKHASFGELLAGTSAVICGGIGQGAADFLSGLGIDSLVVTGNHSIDDAVNRYLAGSLELSDARVCLCG